MRRDDRRRALREAVRVARSGAPVFVVAISRWAPRLPGLLVRRLDEQFPRFAEFVAVVERNGYGHRCSEVISPATPTGPDEFRSESVAADLHVVSLVGIEGMSSALPDLEGRLADPAVRDLIVGSERAIEDVPELLGVSPHLLATTRAP